MMEVEEKENLVPQEKEGITEVAWKSIQHLNQEIPETYPLIMELIREVCAGRS